jgi:hypothetical protein
MIDEDCQMSGHNWCQAGCKMFPSGVSRRTIIGGVTHGLHTMPVAVIEDYFADEDRCWGIDHTTNLRPPAGKSDGGFSRFQPKSSLKTKDYRPHAQLYPSTDLAQFHGTLFGFYWLFYNFLIFFRISKFFLPEHH